MSVRSTQRAARHAPPVPTSGRGARLVTLASWWHCHRAPVGTAGPSRGCSGGSARCEQGHAAARSHGSNPNRVLVPPRSLAISGIEVAAASTTPHAPTQARSFPTSQVVTPNADFTLWTGQRSRRREVPRGTASTPGRPPPTSSYRKITTCQPGLPEHGRRHLVSPTQLTISTRPRGPSSRVPLPRRPHGIVRPSSSMQRRGVCLEPRRQWPVQVGRAMDREPDVGGGKERRLLQKTPRRATPLLDQITSAHTGGGPAGERIQRSRRDHTSGRPAVDQLNQIKTTSRSSRRSRPEVRQLPHERVARQPATRRPRRAHGRRMASTATK